MGKGKNRGGRLVLHIYTGTQHCLVKKMSRHFAATSTYSPFLFVHHLAPSLQSIEKWSHRQKRHLSVHVTCATSHNSPWNYCPIPRSFLRPRFIFSNNEIGTAWNYWSNKNLDYFAYRCVIINSNKNFEVNSMNIFHQCWNRRSGELNFYLAFPIKIFF